MTHDDLPRLSADELAEIDRYLCDPDAPASPDPAGPLPPLESDNPEWVAERWREWAAGTGGPVWKSGRVPRRKSQSGLLREWRADECVVQVWCRRSLIAAVALRDGAYDLVTLAQRHGAWIVHETFPLSITSTRAVACGDGRHDLDTAKLLRLSRTAAPGDPRVVRVWEVSNL